MRPRDPRGPRKMKVLYQVMEGYEMVASEKQLCCMVMSPALGARRLGMESLRLLLILCVALGQGII